MSSPGDSGSPAYPGERDIQDLLAAQELDTVRPTPLLAPTPQDSTWNASGGDWEACLGELEEREYE